MKSLRFLFLVNICGMLFVGCGEHPSSLVGVWANGDRGIIGVQTVLVLKRDGHGSFTAGSLLSGENGSFDWSYSSDQLVITASNKTGTAYRVVSKSATDLVLQHPTGAIVAFKKIGDSPTVDISTPVAELRAAPAPPIKWNRDLVLDGLRRGLQAKTPPYVTISDVQFTVVRAVPPDYSIRGKLVFTFIEDTYRPLSDGPVIGVSGRFVRLCRLHYKQGSTLEQEFEADFKADEASNVSIRPTKAPEWYDHGKPLEKMDSYLVEGSAAAQEAQRVADDWRDARKKLERMAYEFDFAVKLLQLTSPNQVEELEPAAWRNSVNQAMTYIGFGEGKEHTLMFRDEVPPFGNAFATPAARQRFVDDVLAEKVLPEARRLAALRESLIARAKAGFRYFNGRESNN